MANTTPQSLGVGAQTLPLEDVTKNRIDPMSISPSSASAERRFLTEIELANRWGLSPKTLQRWRGLGRGPLFAKFSKKVGYPINGQGGVLDWEQRILYRSTSERAFA